MSALSVRSAQLSIYVKMRRNISQNGRFKIRKEFVGIGPSTTVVNSDLFHVHIAKKNKPSRTVIHTKQISESTNTDALIDTLFIVTWTIEWIALNTTYAHASIM